MGKIDNQGIWENIKNSVQETERLMGQKKYNLSMIKARQTMEYMVKLQCDKAGIVEGSTDQMIRDLYEAKAISKSTAEHYLQILSIGNKATKDGDNSAYNANQAYHVLSQEMYAFANADRSSRPRRNTASKQQSAQPQSRKRQAASQAASQNSSVSRSAKSSKKSKSSGLSTNDLIKLLIPIALIIVLIFVIKVLTPDKDPTSETTTPAATQPTIEAVQQPTEADSPEAPTETAAPVIYKTTTTLNVRSGPSTETERIGKLDPGATVTFVRDHDDFWAVILYNDQEAYVAKEYLTAATE